MVGMIIKMGDYYVYINMMIMIVIGTLMVDNYHKIRKYPYFKYDEVLYPGLGWFLAVHSKKEIRAKFDPNLKKILREGRIISIVLYAWILLNILLLLIMSLIF